MSDSAASSIISSGINKRLIQILLILLTLLKLVMRDVINKTEHHPVL